jgi:anti-anti-sigma factor
VDQEERGMFYRITVTGELTFRAVPLVREAFQSAVEIGHIYVAFDLAGVTLIDSGGIGLIANANKKLVDKGGSAYLIGISAHIRPSLETGDLLQAIPCFDDVEQADKQIG